MDATNLEFSQPPAPPMQLSGCSTPCPSLASTTTGDDHVCLETSSDTSLYEGTSSYSIARQAQPASTTLQRFLNNEDTASHARANGLATSTEQASLTINNLNDIEAVLMILDVPRPMSRSSTTYTAGSSAILANGHYTECGSYLEGATFEHWLNHILDKHLACEVPGGMACPLCPERHLLGDNHNDVDESVRSVMRLRLCHLSAHSPWLTGRCEWPLLVQGPHD